MRDCRQQPGRRFEEPVSLAFGVRLDLFRGEQGAPAQRRDEMRELADAIHVGQLRFEQPERALAHVPLDRLDEWLVRHERFLVRPAEQRDPAVGDRAREIGDEARLADSRLAANEHELAASGAGLIPGGAHRVQLRVPADERGVALSRWRERRGRRDDDLRRVDGADAMERPPLARDRLERGQRFSRALIAVRRIARKAAFDHTPDRGIDVGGRRRRRLLQDGGQELGNTRPIERLRAANQFLQQDAERPDVAPRVGRRSAELLGRHGMRRPPRVSGFGHPRAAAVRAPRQPEIHDLDPAARRQEHVRRLQIAVDDAALVGVRDGADDLHRDVERPLARRALGRDQLAERLTLDVLHHDKGPVAVLGDFVDRADVRMVEGRGRTRLRENARRPLSIVLGVYELDRDRPLQAAVERQIDRAHASCPEEVLYLVLPHTVARLKHGRVYFPAYVHSPDGFLTSGAADCC